MIRVLIITGAYAGMKDGVADYCHRLAGTLAREHPDLDVHVLTGSAEMPVSKTRENVHTVVKDWTWRSLPRVLDAVRSIGPAIVHIQYPSLGYGRHLMPTMLPAILRTAGRWKVAITLHGFGLYTALGKTRLSFAALGSHAIIPVSDHIRTAAQVFFMRWPVLNANVKKLSRPIYVGSSIEPRADRGKKYIEKLRRTWGTGPGEVVVVYFGFINEGKGFDDLLRALAICRDRGLGFRLVCIADLCTKDDAYHAQMWALARELGLRAKIVFTGYLQPERVAEHLGAADLAVLPFNYGASTKRSSLLAALSCGLPVITTGDPSLPSFFVDGQNIMLVPVKDPEALAEAIRKLAGDRVLRLRLRRGAVKLSRHFNWSDIARQHRYLYQQLTKTVVAPERRD